MGAACKGLQVAVTGRGLPFVSALLLEVCWPPEAGGGDGSVAPASYVYKYTRVTENDSLGC